MLIIQSPFSIVGNIFTSLPRDTRRALKHLKPIIEVRLEAYEANGSRKPEKSVNLFSNKVLIGLLSN